MKLRKVPLLILLALVACTLGVIPGCLQNPFSPVPSPAPTSSDAASSESHRAQLPKSTPPKVGALPGGERNQASAQQSGKSNTLVAASGSSASGTPRTSDTKDASPNQSLPDQPQKLGQGERALQNSLNQLATGAFFHNVPHTMRSNRSEIIEAGITKNFTEQLRQELQGQGEVVVKQNVRYDPTGVTIQLKASPEEFYINQISGGKQVPIVDGKSEIWRWKVTPLRRGIHYLNLTSTVDIYVPQQERKYSKEVVIYKEPISVQVNVGYSIQLFVLNHGLQVVISAIAILFGLFSWWRGLYPRSRVKGLQHLQ